MSKRKQRRVPAKPRPSRSGTPWSQRATAEPPDLGPVEQQTLVVWLLLSAELGREPEPHEVSGRVGLRDAKPYLATLRSRALLVRLRPKQRDCLRAIAALEARLGRSPSTREVSAEMGLSPAGSRWHISELVRLGLVTPPEMRLVLSVTAAGRAFVPPPTKAP